jgi:hypothetical protein
MEPTRQHSDRIFVDLVNESLFLVDATRRGATKFMAERFRLARAFSACLGVAPRRRSVYHSSLNTAPG